MTMNYFDMHSHILPGVDDGCKTVEQSLELINIHLKNGVKNICLTPHYYSNEISLEDFADARDEAFEKLKPRLPEGVTVLYSRFWRTSAQTMISPPGRLVKVYPCIWRWIL